MGCRLAILEYSNRDALATKSSEGAVVRWLRSADQANSKLLAKPLLLSHRCPRSLAFDTSDWKQPIARQYRAGKSRTPKISQKGDALGRFVERLPSTNRYLTSDVFLIKIVTLEPRAMKSIWEIIGSGNNEELAEALRASPVAASEISSRGILPLILATQANNVGAMRMIIAAGASAGATTSIRSAVSGRLDRDASPIMFATSLDALRVLVVAGADVNAVDAEGRTVFLRLGFVFDAALLEELIIAGVAPSLEDVKRLADTAREELDFRVANGPDSTERVGTLREFTRWCDAWSSGSRGLSDDRS